MPVQINITLDAKKLRRSLLDLGRNGTAAATSSALNKTLKSSATEAKRTLQKEIGVKKQRTISKRMSLHRASRSRLKAKLVIKEENLPLSALKAVKARGFGRKSVVTWREKRLDKSFKLKSVSTRNGGGSNLKGEIWTSGTKARYKSTGNRKIYRTFGYTLLQEYRHHNVHDHLREFTTKRFTLEFDRALKFQLQKRGF